MKLKLNPIRKEWVRRKSSCFVDFVFFVNEKKFSNFNLTQRGSDC